MNGAVLIDKPQALTSHDVVNRWRRLANTKRVGHLGTLDPMATGLLVLVTGTATRLAQFFGAREKTYLAEITLGLVSDSYDADGEVRATGITPPSDPAEIITALKCFLGRFSQIPPAISAKKIKGIPAYKLARKHVPVELQPVEVEVTKLEARMLAPDRVEMEVTCSAGTYVRGLAHDLGERLGCGAVLTKLRRTRSGEFTVDQARTLEQLAELTEAGRLHEAVIGSGELLAEIPAEHFNLAVEAQIRQGRDFRTSPFVVRPGAPLVRALSHSGELIAIGQLKIPNLYHPSTVL
ncbi:MAG: tRNA pseudouridine(55) synthase TruB [Acidobacteriaceae bacterium]|nr:tRNA pseudouridine(55) synthase TruB [Acidobacteriaceae bacterium]